MNDLKIVFAGTPAFGLSCLNALAQSQHHLQAIYTQPDRPAGRGRKMQASAIKEWGLAQEIPIYQPLNFKNPETIAELAAFKPDVLIVIAYGLILPQNVLDIPRLGCINVHASLLPRWRGASPIQHAILYGDKESGITIMQMDKGMDTGDMLAQVSYPITCTDTASTLHDKLASISAKPLLKVLTELANNMARHECQNNELVTYAGKISKQDALINWESTATEIDQKIRAFNPWPIAYTHFNGETMRIHQAQVITTDKIQIPGTLLNMDKKGLLIATKMHALLVEKIQLPGTKVIPVADWLNSAKSQLHVGFRFE